MKGNKDNLKPVRSKDEARERGRKGGIASGKSRRERKSQRELAQMVLDLPLRNATVGDVMSLADAERKNTTAGHAALIALMRKAVNGDGKAYEIVRDTAGEKPADHLEVEQAPDVAAAEADIAVKIAALRERKRQSDEAGA